MILCLTRIVIYESAGCILFIESIRKNVVNGKKSKKWFYGIANSTVSEWKKKKTNPSSDKIMDICAVLGVTPEQLLTGKGIEDVEETQTLSESRITPLDMQIIEDYHGLQDAQKKRLLAYVETLKKLEALEKL